MTTTRLTTERTHLTPEDAYYVNSPPLSVFNGSEAIEKSDSLPPAALRKSRDQRRNRSKSRRRKTTFQKLLWVKHKNYPDNYTDETTFLDHLQFNPRLRPYEFWPLVADSTVIVQQLCTMIIFVCCFSGIIQERISPIIVVSSGTIGTVLGWVLWDTWVAQEEAKKAKKERSDSLSSPESPPASAIYSNYQAKDFVGLGLQMSPEKPLSSSHSYSSLRNSKLHSGTSTTNSSYSHLSKLGTITEPPHAHSQSHHNLKSARSLPQITATPTMSSAPSEQSPYHAPDSRLSPRTQSRLATAKSAFLIYCFLLGLSPILKSLTKSTASDSIWAISFWLCCINIFFFDYSTGIGPSLPASLSTNAVLMASTVLASRLPSTTHVFSLTLFSIEVFGLFPVFRRWLRHVSQEGHLALTILLVMGAGGGVTVISSSGGWKAWIIGIVGGCLFTGMAMGVCSWWLIGLQRYKNEIRGPWDVAHPVLRRRWD